MASPEEPVAYRDSVFGLLAASGDVLHEIFALLPVDTRLRCREVCPEWRDLLEDPPLWWTLDVSADGGVARGNVCIALLRAVSLRATGFLALLVVSDCDDLVYDAETSTFNPDFLAFLSELRYLDHLVWQGETVPEADTLSQLLVAARVKSKACVNIFVRSFDKALAILRREAPYEAACPHYFCLQLNELEDHDWPEFARLLPNCAQIDRLNLIRADLRTPGHLDCIVDAALAMGLESVHLLRSPLDPTTAVPALARLLRGGVARLEVLQCPYIQTLLQDDCHVAELCAALRGNVQLRELTLGGIDLWHNVETGNAIVRALSGHPSLLGLVLCCNRAAPHQSEVYDALVALVADSPALIALNIRGVLFRCDEHDSDIFQTAFHADALDINPKLSLASLQDDDDAPDEEEDESSEPDSESESSDPESEDE